MFLPLAQEMIMHCRISTGFFVIIFCNQTKTLNIYEADQRQSSCQTRSG